MNNKDNLQRFLFEKAAVRGEIVHLNSSYRTIIEQHAYPPMIQRLLGEMLVVAVLLSATLKFKGRFSIQFQSKGKIKLLLAQCNDDFHIRALAQWNADISPSDLIAELKQGMLAVTIDPDEGERYQGIVAWQGDSLVQSIEAYFRDSEQLNTKLWIAVDDNVAAGLLLQSLPQDKEIETDDWNHLIHLTATITPDELIQLDHETLLRRLYVEEEVRLFESEPVIFRCQCSTEKSEGALLLAGREEVEAELNDKQIVVVTCDFCNKEYSFDRVDVARIFHST